VSQPQVFDVVVLGGGAAGLMCAMRAGQRGRKVLLLDHAEKVGKKILISGGGRCNFTNREARPEAFLSANPHFCKSALARYTQHDFIDLVNKHRIVWHEKTLGQLFCDGSARQIVAMLLDECAAVGVDVRVAHKVMRVEKSDRFTVTTDHGFRGAGDGRALDSEDGRDRLRARGGAQLRTARHRHAAGAGAAHLARTGDQRRVARRRGALWPYALS
jgi:predicted flavoprotein YhiN